VKKKGLLGNCGVHAPELLLVQHSIFIRIVSGEVWPHATCSACQLGVLENHLQQIYMFKEGRYQISVWWSYVML